VDDLWAEACRFLAGGVNSPVRAFRAVGGTPVFVRRGAGPRIEDAQGRSFVDWVCSWGALIAGHAHPRVIRGLIEQLAYGTSYGAPCELETALAREICERVPSCERVRFVSSGTEATMSAIRLARGITGRDEIAKCDGCYHGHADSLLVQAGSGVATLAIPGSPGVPAALAHLTRVVPFNDLDALELLFTEHGEQLAALIVEPIAGNMGVVPPHPEWLATARELTRRHGSLLIYDEVITGFRVQPGGAQALYRQEPDLTCFGKIIGGGLPAAAYGGRAELMARLAPEGPIYQAGTLSGNPLAMRAGLETLVLLDEPGAYERLEETAARLAEGLVECAERADVPVTLNRVGSMLTLYFGEGPVSDFASVKATDAERYPAFFHGMLRRGVYLAPSPYEAWFVSLAHGEAELDETLAAAAATFEEIAA
jgi:glutamate-1-semialdehyde 2,1-aminomutase